MLKKIILFLLIFFILAPIYAQEEKVDPNEWNFGKIEQGAILKHDFILKNQAKKIFNITGISTSCGCTVSQSAKKSLAPGEKTVLSVSFNSQGYLGKIQQFVYVNTDNSDMAIIKFTIKAEVEKGD